MKRLRMILVFAFIASLFPAALWAKEVPATLTLEEALAIVQKAYKDEVTIVNVGYDTEKHCWEFEFAAGTQVCVDDVTAEIVPFDPGANVDTGAIDTPEATPDPANTDDGAVDNVDTGSVDTPDAIPGPEATPDPANTDDGAVSVDPPVLTAGAVIAIARKASPNGAITKISFQRLTSRWAVTLDDGVIVEVDDQTADIVEGNTDEGAVSTSEPDPANVDEGAVSTSEPDPVNVDEGAVSDPTGGTDDGLGVGTGDNSGAPPDAP